MFIAPVSLLTRVLVQETATIVLFPAAQFLLMQNSRCLFSGLYVSLFTQVVLVSFRAKRSTTERTTLKRATGSVGRSVELRTWGCKCILWSVVNLLSLGSGIRL